jgi:acyl-CoA synthetase (AMP-forming)/AMP-acid ligase II
MFQEAYACLINKPDSTVLWENIKDFIENKSIAKQESIYFRVLIPKYHIFVDSFPRTASGKVAKKLLKEDVLKALKLS